MNSLRVIFMGTPEFAVPSLEALVENRVNIVAVITAVDKPQGRGQKLAPSPVKRAAIQHGIPVLQPTNLKSEAFLKELKDYNANLQVVVAFRMLPESVWAMPALGTFNLHASLLPNYRGAAPINWAIVNGETETGVTTFFLQHDIDTGSIIFQEKEIISPADDAGSLYQKLMTKGASLVVKTVQAIESGNFASVPQADLPSVHHAPKIFRETCAINWNQPVTRVRNFIRGLSPYPSAWTLFNRKEYKILRVSLLDSNKSGMAGEFDTNNRDYLYVKATDGWVAVEEIQPEGKRRMTVAEFFRGNTL